MTAAQFARVDARILKEAELITVNALEPSSAARLISKFYNPQSNFAGAAFAGLEPHGGDAITATDLLAVTTMGVSIPVLAIRRFLDDAEIGSRVRQALAALPDRPLEDATPEDFEKMARFYDLVKEQLKKAGTNTSNSWVTASKIAARMRPDLFPVRDRVVCRFLGIIGLNDRAKDWVVFQHLMNSSEVRRKLSEVEHLVRDGADGHRLVLDTQPLRLLDAVLWMSAPRNCK